jgi:hypothetical protein
MKKIALLITVFLVFGTVLIFREPPINAQKNEVETIEIPINLDSLSSSIYGEVSKIKSDKIEVETLNLKLEKTISDLNKKVTVLSNTKPKIEVIEKEVIKIDTVYIVDTIKGSNYKTNIFGKKKKIN